MLIGRAEFGPPNSALPTSICETAFDPSAWKKPGPWDDILKFEAS